MITQTGNVAIDDLNSAVSWGAIIAGTVASAALTLMLVAFGIGVGFTVISPWSDAVSLPPASRLRRLFTGS